jgi:hypothetical protein
LPDFRGAIMTFVMSLVALLVVTFIAEFLAPKFGGEANRRQALKWVAYRRDGLVGRRHFRAHPCARGARMAGTAFTAFTCSTSAQRR